MGLFGRKKKEKQVNVTWELADVPAPVVLRSVTYNYSPGFRGSRRIKLASDGSETAQAGINALKIPNPAHEFEPNEPDAYFDFNGAKIKIEELEYGRVKGNSLRERLLKVYVNGHHIGTIFQPYVGEYAEYASALIWGRASIVHIKIEPVMEYYRNKAGALVPFFVYQPYIFVKPQ